MNHSDHMLPRTPSERYRPIMRNAPRESDRLNSAVEECRALRRHTGELIAGARKQLQAPPDIEAVMREALLVRARASLNVAAARRVHYDPHAY